MHGPYAIIYTFSIYIMRLRNYNTCNLLAERDPFTLVSLFEYIIITRQYMYHD